MAFWLEATRLENFCKKPVLNIDLWQRLDKALEPRTIEWHWVKGHSGHSGNERADSLANLGIDELSM